MANSTRTTRVRRVIGALVVAGVFIVGAYIVSGPVLPFLSPGTANAADTQALLQAAAQKSTEAIANGLNQPKFISAVATSAPETVDPSSMPGPTAAPGSMTDQFAQSLFGQYLSDSDGTEPSEEDISNLVQEQLQQLSASHATQDAYTVNDIHVGEAGADALKQYAADVETALVPYATTTNESELDYFSDAVENNDTSALTQVAAIGNAYSAMAPALMQVTVPVEAENDHVALVNTIARLGEDITDMSTMSTDPLRAYLGLYQYQTDEPSFVTDLANLNQVFVNENVSLTSGPGAGFYAITSLAAAHAPASQ